jgi:2-dehydro-3-deoxyphosphooctonate aldolase (KDO 8-P synthase)
MKRFTVGAAEIGGRRLFALAGPCVVESAELCLRVAASLSAACTARDVPFVFKASYRKANRSSGRSFEGLGMDEALAALARVKRELGVPILTDVHETSEVKAAAEVADVLQIPAFLARQSALLRACAASGRAVNVKKGQFLAPEDMHGVLQKTSTVGNKNVMLTERGACLGYHNLVVDMRGLQIMRGLGAPVCMDATHAVQRPGASASGRNTGDRQFVAPLARAAAAVGIDALFCEVHEDPATAPSDGENACTFPLLERILDEVLAVRAALERLPTA